MATHHQLTAQAEPVAHEDVVTSYRDAPTRTVSAGGVSFAYRELGPKTGVPVIFLTHLAAVLDNWDPRVVDGIAAKHRVITFDNRGVGATTGSTPDTIQAMAKDAIASIVLGVEPLEAPTPRLSNVMTRCRVAMPSTTRGSQLSSTAARWVRKMTGTPARGPSSR